MPAKLAAVLSISILLTSACTDPSDIGLELDPENNQIGVFYTEIPLSASMVLLDSFNTTNAGVIIAGGDVDPFFGTTEATGFSRLAFNVQGDRPGSTAILDSAKFRFDLVNVTGRSFGENKTLTVHRLLEGLKDTTYYNTDRLAFEESPIVSASFRLEANKDTLIFAPLQQALAVDLFNRVKNNDPAFTDLFSFRNFFPGIAIKGNLEEQTSMPIRQGNSTGIVLYYHNEGDTTNTVRTFPISSVQSRHFSNITNNRIGTPIESIQEAGRAYDVGDRVGTKGGTGLVMKLNTAPLDQFLDTLRNVVFNQVILDMGPIEDFEDGNAPFRSFLLYFADENGRVKKNANGNALAIQADGQAQLAADAAGNVVPAVESPAAFGFVNDKLSYRQAITSYMNAVYSSGLQRNHLLLYPDRLSTNESPSLKKGGVFKQSLRQHIVDQNNIKLKIYYSKIR